MTVCESVEDGSVSDVSGATIEMILDVTSKLGELNSIVTSKLGELNIAVTVICVRWVYFHNQTH